MGAVTYADYASNTSMTVTLAEVQATTTGPEQRLDVEGAGQVADLPFRLTGHGGALQDLNGNKPYPVQVQLVVDQWQGDLNGTVAQPLQMQGVAAEVSLARVFPDQPSGNQGQGGTGGAGPDAVSTGGPSDAGGGRLGGAGADRDPGEKRSGWRSCPLMCKANAHCWRRSSSRAPWMCVTWPSPRVPLASHHPQGLL